MRFCRKWRARRVAYTEEVIAFANVAENQLLDLIPLEVISGIEEMQVSSERGQVESAIETTVDFTNAFQIRTRADGYNAGRSYFLQVKSDQDLAGLIQGITSVAKCAARKARARSPWAIAQEHARTLYNSSWFQGTAAFLIIAVSAALMPHHSRSAELPSHAYVSRISASRYSRRNCKRTSFTRPMDRRPFSRDPWTQRTWASP